MTQTFGKLYMKLPLVLPHLSPWSHPISPMHSSPPGPTIRFDWHSGGAGRGCWELIRSLRGISTLLLGLDYLLQVQVTMQQGTLGLVLSTSHVCPLPTPLHHVMSLHMAATKHRCLTSDFSRTMSQSKPICKWPCQQCSVTAATNANW